MYLHIGQNEIIPDRRIIGILDLDKCSYEKRTRDYLSAAEQEGVVLDVSGELPKSFVVCDHPYHRQIVYLSQLNASTLKKRAELRHPDLLRLGVSPEPAGDGQHPGRHCRGASATPGLPGAVDLSRGMPLRHADHGGRLAAVSLGIFDFVLCLGLVRGGRPFQRSRRRHRPYCLDESTPFLNTDPICVRFRAGRNGPEAVPARLFLPRIRKE